MRHSAANLALALVLIGAVRSHAQSVETDPSKVSHQEVLKAGPEAQVDYYRKILQAFTALKGSAGDGWRTAPFAPFERVVKEMESETQRLQGKLKEAGDLEEANLGDEVLASMKAVVDAGTPIFATVALGSAFTRYAGVAPRGR
jgi:hypothetical protein